jgi:hypothetical protein
VTSGGASEQAAEAAEILVPLAAEATVRIHAAEPGNPFVGSGFFVARNWVLTCAHVAWAGRRPARGRPAAAGEPGEPEAPEAVDAARPAGEAAVGAPRNVLVGHGDNLLSGVVEWASAPGPEAPRQDAPGRDAPGSDAPGIGGPQDRWPVPDLALIRLTDQVDHPCVWLTERTPKGYTTNQVAYFGWLLLDGEPVPYNGRCTVSGQLGVAGGGALRLSNDDEMPQGLSGGPVIDLVRGEVIGVLKARRKDRDGGLAVSVQQLRHLPAGADSAADLYHRVMTGHDLYHADRHRYVVDDTFYGWTDAHTDIGAAADRALTPGQRTALLGLLAQLPPPAAARTLQDLVAEVRGGTPQGYTLAPRGWRDGLGMLYDLRRGSELEAVLRYAMLAATDERAEPAEPAAERALWEWAEDTAAAQGLSMRFRNSLATERRSRLRARAVEEPPTGPEHRPRGQAQLEIIPRGWEPDRFDWRVTVTPENGDTDCVQEDFHGTPVAELPARLAGPLAEAFRRCDEPGRTAPLHLAVPGSLMAFAADAWHLAPDGPALGTVRPLVVRRTDPPPDEDPAVAEERLGRWRALHGGRPAPEILDCDQAVAADLPDDETLRGRPRDLLPVLCRSAETAPEALHRLIRCGYAIALWRREPIGPDRVCADFHRGVPRTVHAAGTAAGLPAALAALRAAVAEGVPEAYWSAGLALLYDDPTRPLPGTDELLETP